MKKTLALAAALVLAVSLAGCGLRDERSGPSGPQTTGEPAPAGAPAAAQDALDDLDTLLGRVDQALADMDSFAASADAD